MAQKREREIPEEAVRNDYPIAVTKTMSKAELYGWYIYLKDKGYEARWREKHGRYQVFRRITPAEIEEMKQGRIRLAGERGQRYLTVGDKW